MLDEKHMKKYIHLGTPLKFPCLVISEVDPSDVLSMYEHKFIYVNAAARLLQEHNKRCNRLNFIT